MIGGLYQQTPDYAGRAMQTQQGVAQTTASMQRKPVQQQKTAGGALSAGLGGAIAGEAIGEAIGGMWAGPAGIAAGVGFGLLSYFF